MADESSTADLQARIEELEDQIRDLHAQVRRADIEQWQGRVDDLEVQVHLGSAELRDRLEPMVEALRNRWLDAREQMDHAGSTTSDTLDVLRGGLEAAVRDLRKAILDARSTVAG
jgi:hypothetical protein